jgi:hypothetical protein
MYQALFRTVEVLFTAYAVPALIVPLVWLFARIARSPSGRPQRPWVDLLSRGESVYAALAAFCILAGTGALLGLPVERGGTFTRTFAWCAYSAVNIAFAWLLVRFTAGYGEIQEEDQRDRLFSRLLLIVVAQPIVTAFAFALLYRVMGLSYSLAVPGLGAVQEGI